MQTDSMGLFFLKYGGGNCRDKFGEAAMIEFEPVNFGEMIGLLVVLGSVTRSGLEKLAAGAVRGTALGALIVRPVELPVRLPME